MRIFLSFMTLALLMTSLPQPMAWSQPKLEPDGFSAKDSKSSSNTPPPGGTSSSRRGAQSRDSGDEERAARRKYDQAWDDYTRAARAYEDCMNSTWVTVNACRAPKVPGAFYSDITGVPAGGPAIDPQTAAYMAFARLRLTAPTPIIGPSPSINPWKMAAVGYPLWLSVGGDTHHPPQVSDAVAGLRVTLKATVAKVTFAMGDGHRVTCVNVTTKWTSSVEAGAESPSCGYTYRKPSLPKRAYTVTATTFWSVAWSTSTESGVINFAQKANAQLPVGELQVLVR